MEFYRLKGNTENYTDLWYNQDVKHYEKVFCPIESDHYYSKRNHNLLSVVLKSRKRGDFMGTVYSDILITDKVAKIFEENGFTGYTLREVEVTNGTLDSKLWEIVVTGKKGQPDPRCGMILKNWCRGCGRAYYQMYSNEIGLVVDERSWNGNDFFTIIPLPNFILVTERVKRVIEKHNLKGATIIKTTDLRHSSDWDACCINADLIDPQYIAKASDEK